MIKVVRRQPDSNRAILRFLPEQARRGPPSEALLTWRQSQPEPQIILWIAQSDELCEQAVQSFQRSMVRLGPSGRGRSGASHDRSLVGRPECDSLRMRRCSREHSEIACRGAGHGRAMTLEELEVIGERTGVVVIDEAHRALAPSYGAVLNALGISFRRKQSHAALMGLTATPRRASEDETVRLRRRFHNRILSARAWDRTLCKPSEGKAFWRKSNTRVWTMRPDGSNCRATPNHNQYLRRFRGRTSRRC